MKCLALLLPILVVSSVIAETATTPEIALYAGGPIYPKNNVKIQSNIAEIKASGFTTLIAWSIHVQASGDLHFNNQPIVSNGQWIGDVTWATFLSELKQGNSSINKLIFSVGSSDSTDYQDIAALIQSQGTGPSSILYKNFAALKQQIPEIDAIDIDDEDDFDQDLIVQFSLLMGTLGWKVTFDPFTDQTDWIGALATLNTQSPGLVSAINLQTYAGGEGQDPVQWQQAAQQVGVTVPVYPGVESLQNGGSDASDIESQFEQWAQGGITGGSLWIYDQIAHGNPSPAQYAAAIKQGLSGK